MGGLADSHGLFARDRTSDKQVQAKGRSDQTYSQVADHQNTQMDGVNAITLCNGTKNGTEDDKGRAGIHHHA